MKFNVTTATCTTSNGGAGSCGSNAADNPEECANPLFAADNPDTCTDSNGNPVTILRLRINPTSGSTEVGKHYPFRAILVFSDGREKDVTDVSTWTAGNTAVATVASTGYATGVAEGITTIAATFRTYNAFAQLTIQAACTDGNVDFCLVIDRSGSMQDVGSDGKTRMQSAIEATIGFVRNVEYTTDQVAVVSFSGTLDETGTTPVWESNTTVHTTLTNSQTAVESAVSSIDPDFSQCIQTDPVTGKKKLVCLTAIGGGLQAAYDELTSSRARSSARKCVILLTDGGNNVCQIDPEEVADEMRKLNFLVCVIGLAIDDADGMVPCDGSAAIDVKSWLTSLTNCDLFFDAETAEDLPDIYATLPRAVCGFESDPCFYYPDATIAFEWLTTSATASTGTVGVEYSHSFHDENNDFGEWQGDGAVIWTVSGDLPPGVTYNRWTKTLEGTPTEAGVYVVNIAGENGLDPGDVNDKTLVYTITIS